MARGWHYYTKLSLSSALLLFFFWHDAYFVIVPFFLSLLKIVFKEKSEHTQTFFFVLFRCVFFALVGGFCRCSSDIFLSSRPRIGLATTYITGYGRSPR